MVNEQMQVKLMTLILREFRKNREYTKFRDQKRFADSQAKEKLLAYDKPKEKAGPAKANKAPEKVPWGARATAKVDLKTKQPKQGSQ